MGDKGDNVPGIKGLGKKTLEKNIPILFQDKEISLQDILTYIKDNKDSNAIMKKLSESTDRLKLNYDLMQLNNVNIGGAIKSNIIDIVKKPINRLVKFKFQKMMLEDKLNTAIRNPDLWLKMCFFHLDAMAVKTYE